MPQPHPLTDRLTLLTSFTSPYSVNYHHPILAPYSLHLHPLLFIPLLRAIRAHLQHLIMSDTIPSAPQVNVLAPAPDIDTSHHGPFVSHYFRKNTAYENGLPRFFQNPWPSYRAPSLKDAYTAYNLGAAIAHPSPYRLRMSRSELHLAHNQGKDAYKTEDGADAPRLKNESWLPQNTYVRPIFAEQFEDDEEQDWRDPPVQVVQPTFASEQTDKAKITWLGHAGVLVQVPWQRGERDGMFGVLYDPIFSYRYVACECQS